MQLLISNPSLPFPSVRPSDDDDDDDDDDWITNIQTNRTTKHAKEEDGDNVVVVA